MHELMHAIGNARNLDDLLPILESLMLAVDRLSRRKGITAFEMQKIAVYLTGIRLLLKELEQYEGGTLHSSGRTLAERYLELEGRIKEIRNDLDMAAKKTAT